MLALFYLRRRYSTLLPPTALVRRLQHTVSPPPAFFWRLVGGFRPVCWGSVKPATSSFEARLPSGRSDGPLVRGSWQPAPEGPTHPLAGTSVQLIIRLPLIDLLGGSFLLCLFLGACVLVGQAANSPLDIAVPAGITSLLGLLFTANSWWSIRRAERYFKEALALNENAG